MDWDYVLLKKDSWSAGEERKKVAKKSKRGDVIIESGSQTQREKDGSLLPSTAGSRAERELRHGGGKRVKRRKRRPGGLPKGRLMTGRNGNVNALIVYEKGTREDPGEGASGKKKNEAAKKRRKNRRARREWAESRPGFYPIPKVRVSHDEYVRPGGGKRRNSGQLIG